ncbi:tRNA (adenosine(37)-N6)-threonylcarbamoyltransferase complex dimerization subunit type 1 TsaB [Methylobacter sp. S3L5C]|uniref:tRNA (adenosine(37)-N6)-threonylcarbamoyltransferase complex dimerization subunit type 1 TsaB n=1 Tax=Methylobacter sp. S3L5C TaxID=2839024 RepID=UPI001FAD9D09|nr:tRNA (adenosine(37)-N6)-threonylcarbamoyltransferase complex dimerization subunit type 1 TsaB [Methylobacter sp. S3L5C]UOA07257.1 tRNA (adenosine(37)-N6)-threonylcarbamoyltransferase complex dimerization subunit type 1 TsaB [Methylobacter sp. S3L5C]
MKLLAVETSTEACSAALIIDGVVSERFELAPKEHTRLILPMIDALMSEAGLKPQQLDALAFSCGPGSFTGVRIATAVIQGIALGADLPIVPVSTLAAIAQDFFDKNNDKPQIESLKIASTSCNIAFTAMDARMGEIFWGVYQCNEQGFAELIGKEAVTPAVDVEFPNLIGIGVGSGWGVYHDALIGRLAGRVSYCESDNLPRAGAIARLGVKAFEQGLAVAVEQAMPVYLRDKVAKKESER